MRKLMIKIGLFILPFIVLIGILEVGLGNVQDVYSYKADLFKKQQDQIETLFLGSSPTAYGVDPSYLRANSFNLANLYQFLDQDTALVSKLAAEMPNLKLVVYNLIPPAIELGSRNTEVEILTYKYHQFYDTRFDHWSDWLDLRAYSEIARFGYRDSIDYLLKGFKVSLLQGREFSEEGFVSNSSVGDAANEGETNDEAVKKARIATLITPFQAQGNIVHNQQLIEANIKLLQARNITVAFIISPVMPQYAALYTESYKDTKAFMEEMELNYKVKAYDYYQDNRFSKEHFSDYLHLNSQGAIELSELIAREVMPVYYGKD
ncbi:hypothetical protein BK133_20855 [Paenibacillus sp. FSL H8-0548]|uniref:hypothetical protein n=1 Tax=Paenibacillus sp. FSL H8-0548 TaxID=1920422 RepID=UPI00096F4F31|nr:hypothetical protein [Paenibacillus sp. FSL H8-0548]OMF25776.1 hypothetical protein BK133_20855 [Paenibacillus sp. FSL H8-0548]